MAMRGSVRAAGFQEAPGGDAPFAAHYIVEQQNAESADGETSPIEEGEQVGL